MLLKVLGNLMILSSAIFFGVYMGGIYRGRYLFFVQLRDALSLLEEEMLSLGYPLPEALTRTGERIGGSVQDFLFQLLSYYQGEASLDRILKGMEDQERQILYDWLLSLGKGDREHQRQLFKTLQWRLSKIEERTLEEARKYGRLWHYSGLLMGLMLIIILY